MRALLAVYKRETALFFKSFIAYAIAFAVIGFVGLLFMLGVAQGLLNQAAGQQAGAGITGTALVQGNIGLITFLLFIFAPLLTMRLLSEESREGTLEVLMTLPMGEWTFVFGKFLAAWTYYTFLLALTLVHLFMVWWLLAADMNAAFLATVYLGAWLYGGATLALSIIWSAVAEDQLVAAFLGAATILVFYIAEFLSPLVADQRFFPGLGSLVREIGLTSHYQTTMLEGIIRAEDIFYYVALIGIALFITTLIVGTRRWRAS